MLTVGCNYSRTPIGSWAHRTSDRHSSVEPEKRYYASPESALHLSRALGRLRGL